MAPVPQQYNESSIKFQQECRERSDQAIAANSPEGEEARRFKGILLGTLVGGTSLCLIGLGINHILTNIK
jgi:hypothetical protein